MAADAVAGLAVEDGGGTGGLAEAAFILTGRHV
jgi:hypothetical protein